MSLLWKIGDHHGNLDLGDCYYEKGSRALAKPQPQGFQPVGQKIKPGLVCSGEFSPGEFQVATVTTSDTVLLHNFQSKKAAPVVLNTALPATSIAAIRFPGAETDHLVISTKTSVLVYNVHDNRDIFRKDLVDGGNIVICGELDVPLILVGCNCSVQGYTLDGSDAYWIVTGDIVQSMAIVDFDQDGQDELVVGSEDYDIRVFKNDDLIHEITETQIVTHLYSLGGGLFAYSLANGTVGVYERQQRLWRVKSKHRATQLAQYDVSGDGVAELITGWQGGKVDGRAVRTGEVLFKDNLKETIAGVTVVPGSNILVVVAVTGEVRGYHSSAPKMFDSQAPKLTLEQDTMRELLTRKQALSLELANYYSNARFQGEPPETGVAAIPARTRLQTTIDVNPGSGNQMAHVEVCMATNNDTCIRGVLVFAEGMFKGETQVKHARLQDVGPKLSVALYPPRDIPIDIHIKALVGYPESPQLHVFELTRQLPRFSMYAMLEGRPATAQSNVQFTIQERVKRVILWLNRNFLLSLPDSSDLNLTMICLRDGRDVNISMDSMGKMIITTDNMTLAGDLIQSLTQYLNIGQLQSYAQFPQEEKRCEELMANLQQLENVKRKLTMELGDKSNLIRNLIIRGEDARLLADYHLLRRFYQQLQEVNKDLHVGHGIRCTNYNDSVATVRELNNIVQKASRLRVGKHKTDPVLLARNAVATNNSASIIKAIRCGEA